MAVGQVILLKIGVRTAILGKIVNLAQQVHAFGLEVFEDGV